MTKLKLKSLLLILFCTTLMNVNVSAMEEGQCSKEQPSDVFYLLPAEVLDMIILTHLTNIGAHLENSGNIHELLKRIATLYIVSKYFKKHFEQHRPDLLAVLHGVDPNNQDYDNRIATTKAFLDKHDFFINEGGHRARTLLHQAVQHGDLNKVITLLNLGANPTLLDSLNYSAHTLALEMGNGNIILLLDSILSDIDKKKNNNITPYTATHVATQALVNENFDAFDDWLEKQTPESIAQQFDNHSISDWFVRAIRYIAIRTNSQPHQRITKKQVAQQFDKYSIYNWLIRTVESAEKLTTYISSITALGLQPTVKLINIACQVNNLPALNCLLQQLQPKPTKTELNKALMIAAQCGCSATISRLMKEDVDIEYAYKYKNTALIWAARIGAAKTVKLLIAQGSDINNTNNHKDTALFCAVRWRHINICQLLIDKHANINQANKVGNTPLILAALKGYLEICKLLVNNNANVNDKNGYGNTALMQAARNGHTEVVKLLIGNGANIKCINKYGNTALILAALHGYLEICKLLVEKDANVDHVGYNGNTALDCAEQEGHDEIAAYLKLIAKTSKLADGMASLKI